MAPIEEKDQSMKLSKIVIVFTLALIVAAGAWAIEDTDKPNIVILATGGTIAGSAESQTQAGYESGQVGVEVLINAVPQLEELADVTGEQISNVGSQDMSDAIWLKLATRINELAASDKVDGIVITHGTDTIEETGYFLNLVVKTDKPVVMTASMRPSTALSADGPLNIFNAVANGAKAIVTAGVGNGNMTGPALEAVKRAIAKGVVVVRSSRVPTGATGRNVEIQDDEIGTIASHELNPAKARVLLKLALLKTSDVATIQDYFDRY